MLKTFEKAKAAGDKYYQPTGKCKRGHVSPYLVTGGCLECGRLRAKARAWSKWGCRLSVEDVELVEYHMQELAENNSQSSGIKLVSREEAIDRGLRNYFDGIPCRVRGHVCERYASNKGCMMCWKEDSLTERYSKKSKEWREENSVKHKASIRKWRDENKDRTNMSAAKRRAAMRNRDLCHDEELMDLCMTEAYKHCDDMSERFGGRWEVDHMIPLLSESASGLHVPWNIQVIPQSLNSAKQNRMIYTEDLEWLADAVE